MTRPDDMVIVVDLGREVEPTAPVRAREERRLGHAKNAKSGVFRRLARASASRRIAAAAARSKVARAGLRGGAALSRGVTAGRTAAVANPVGIVVAAGIIAAAVVLRLGTGVSFEQMGQQVNTMLLGDMDEQARAETQIRNQLAGNSALRQAAAHSDQALGQIKQVATGLIEIRKKELEGRTAILEEIDVEGGTTFDLVILAAKRAWDGIWQTNGTAAKWDQFTQRYGELVASESGKGTFR